MGNIPTHLKHKPILYIDEYEKMDGQYKGNDTTTDARFISLGKAQWDTNFVASVKVFRNVNERWSRQSEETTLTRAIDMALLTAEGYYQFIDKKKSEVVNSVFGTSFKIEEVPWADPTMKEQLEKYYKKHKDDIKAHMRLLRDILNRCDLEG